MNKSRRAALYELPTKLQNSKEELGEILEEEGITVPAVFT